MSLEHAVEVTISKNGLLSRRGFLHRVAGGAAACGALGWFDAVTLEAQELRRRGMACILLWMQGGPSQLETFDPKPGHANGGPTRAIATRVDGIQIAEHWPEAAAVMQEIALIRSMTNREGNHQRATYQLHTGYTPAGGVKHPSLGSIAASELGEPPSELPSFVMIGAGGRSQGQGAGILGVRYDPFVLNAPGRPPANATLAVSSERFERRLGLLDRLEDEFAERGGRDLVSDHRSLYGRAAHLALSSRLKAFDLEDEPDHTRESYGSGSFGQGCLLARRLVEAGVTFVEVHSGGWDTHQDNFTRVKELAAQVDRGFAQLVRDLGQRGLLEKTLVIWMGEFGRTPRINPRSGRDHFPRAFSVALAGGGVRGGQVIGQTSEDGMEVVDRPVSVPDLFCSICRSLEIDPRRENKSPLGRPIKIVDGGSVVAELFA
jgi:hypothetical protein